ncbi:hypothetical protein G9F72_023085 [Clostridium estertheticum]|uniref:hypothetical protein n=1 Tax=Clostridium estertheticum TaxID=238834 RepID=UPI0013E96942|nr:hypothetical protein [Clostridium estertheticum]MBZ9689187.1 hypothetical protein [Clostridium estertheticum]
MARTKGFKKIRGILTLIITLGALAVFAYMILYNGDVVVKKTDSTEVINKLIYIKAKGGEFGLIQKEIDELSNIYFEKPISKGNITLQGVNIKLLKDELLIEAPISFNKINLLLSSTGKLSFSNGKIAYVADNFKIGKLPLPKSLVISQLKKQNNKAFYVEDNIIKIKESVLPFKLTSLKIVDSKILGTAEKSDIKTLIEDFSNSNVADIDKQLATLEQKIQDALVLMNETQKQEMKQIQNTIDGVKGKSIEEKKKVISDINSKLNKAISETKSQ